MNLFVVCMIRSYLLNQRNPLLVEGLSFISPVMAYVYKVLLVYSSFTIVSGQSAGRPIQSLAELFLQVVNPSLLVH